MFPFVGLRFLHCLSGSLIMLSCFLRPAIFFVLRCVIISYFSLFPGRRRGARGVPSGDELLKCAAKFTGMHEPEEIYNPSHDCGFKTSD